MSDTPTDLSFEIADLIQLERAWSRSNGEVARDETLHVALDYTVPVASYSKDRGEVVIETRYDFSVLESSAPDAAIIGTAASRFAVVLRSNRPIVDDDVTTGALDVTQDVAHEASHPYHRYVLETVTKEMGLPEFSLPVYFDGVRAQIVEHNSDEPR